MKKKIAVIFPQDPELKTDTRLREVLETALLETEPVFLYTAEQVTAYFADARTGRTGEPSGKKALRPVLFAAAVGSDGINLELTRVMRALRRDPDLLEDCVGGVIIDGQSDLYTKAVARELVFTANCAGCAFVGRPLTEGTRTLSNFFVVAQNLSTDAADAYRQSAAGLVREILNFGSGGGHFLGTGGTVAGGTVSGGTGEKAEPVPDGGAEPEGKTHRPKLLVLHASIRKTSNTLALWHMTAEHLDGIEIQELSLQNGTLYDCAGCPYRTCLHFGEQGSCFYGGVMAESVYPAVREADGIVMLCANYNDALSANLTAFINRLTALFRQVRFYDKALFGVVVSGYSGSDILAEQLIAALNMNKTFFLPGHFALMETANNAGQAARLPGIEERTARFAERIRKTLLEK